MCSHRSFVVVLAAAAMVPYALTLCSHAQSISGGQVAARFASKKELPTPVQLTALPRMQGGAKLAAPVPAGVSAADLQADRNALKQAESKSGSTAQLQAWTFIVNEDTALNPDPNLPAARALAQQISANSQLTASEAVQLAFQACYSQQEVCKEWQFDAEARTYKHHNVSWDDKTILDRMIDALKSTRCDITPAASSGSAGVASSGNSSQTTYNFSYPRLLPTFGSSCSTSAIQNFFAVGKNLNPASNVQYLYNAQQSTSQINAQLLTADFSGFQLIFSGTTTNGTGQSSTGSSTGSTTSGTGQAAPRLLKSRFGRAADSGTGEPTSGQTSSTDSVDTAVSQLEQGGDFNVSFLVPLLNLSKGNVGLYGFTSPNIGFDINGFSGQNTITESTEYGFNFPVEFYGQLMSIDKDANNLPKATIFLDAREGMDVISSVMATDIGLKGSRVFQLGQASAGVSLSGGVQLSFQYFYGPSGVYQAVNSSGTVTTNSTNFRGLHVAVSFSPQKKSSSSN